MNVMLSKVLRYLTVRIKDEITKYLVNVVSIFGKKQGW